MRTRKIECRKIFKISKIAVNFITKAMKIWWVELAAGEKTLEEVKNSRGHHFGTLTLDTTICYGNDAYRPYTKETKNLQIHF